MIITIKEQQFILHPSGAIYWQNQNLLLISDVHLGKVSHFRKHGIAIPNNAVPKNFERLTEVVRFYKPEKVIFLGDLFHSSKNVEWQLFQDWANSCSSIIILIEGNHDIIKKSNYEKIAIKVFSSLIINDFILTHHPIEHANLFNFCGHIHPGILLRGFGGQALKLPCFYQQQNQMILPAFGEFTGKFIVQPNQNDLIYAVTDTEVILISKN